MKNMTQIAGGRDDFQLVRHLTLHGSQVEIGRALTEEALRLGWAPTPADPAVNRARRTWFERHWPQHHARMDGAAAALGLDPDQDELALDGLSFIARGLGLLGAVVPALRAPPTATAGWAATTTSSPRRPARSWARRGRPGELPMSSRPYVITTVPDTGLASTVITMTELDGCMDGVNEAGLVVMLLIADIANAEPPEDVSPQVGLSSVQLPRFVVDTCENVEQAKQALLGAKQYDHGVPLHYLVADAHGGAFVWERGKDGEEHIIEFGDAPLCVTNHLLHRNPDPMNLPEDTESSFQTLRAAAFAVRAEQGRTDVARPTCARACSEVRTGPGHAVPYDLEHGASTRPTVRCRPGSTWATGRRRGTPTSWSSPRVRYSCLTLDRDSLPVGVRGSASRYSITFGCLNRAMRGSQCRSSSAVSSGPPVTPARRLDERDHAVPPLLVGHADDGHVGHRRGAPAARPRSRPDRC